MVLGAYFFVNLVYNLDVLTESIVTELNSVIATQFTVQSRKTLGPLY
jgi:hypothetical protein